MLFYAVMEGMKFCYILEQIPVKAMLHSIGPQDLCAQLNLVLPQTTRRVWCQVWQGLLKSVITDRA